MTFTAYIIATFERALKFAANFDCTIPAAIMLKRAFFVWLTRIKCHRLQDATHLMMPLT